MKKLGIVCGYGNFLDKNIQNYVNSIVEFTTHNQIYNLILSGGSTFKSSNVSEANLMSTLVREQSSNFNLILEENALTTLHNLLYSAKLIEQLNLSPETLYIFCDDIRFTKVKLLSKIIFRGKSVKVIKFGREEPNWVYIMQIPSTIFQIAGVLFPSLESKLLLAKKTWINKYR